MDLVQAASYFSDSGFDAYDFLANAWADNAFVGQMKYAPESFSINDLSSRKRMLFTAFANTPTSSVVRVHATGQVFMVEGRQVDLVHDTPYMNVYNVHEVLGPAQVWRNAPTGPSNDPGWAVNVQAEATFGDVILQRAATDEEQQVNQYGFYTVYLPHDSTAQDHDTVVLDGQTYYLFEVYWDQGLRAAKATNRPYSFRNIEYIKVVNGAYNPATLTAGKTETHYNITAQVDPLRLDEMPAGNIAHDAIKVLIFTSWIGVTPQVDDKIVVFGKTYLVKQISRNAILDQWELVASV